MKNRNKQNSGFIDIEAVVVLIVLAIMIYVASMINDSVIKYADMKTKLDKATSDLIMTKSVVANQKLQINNLTKELAITQSNYEGLINKKQKVVEKVAVVKDKKKVKEKEVIDNDVQLKTSGVLSEESLNKLSEIRSLALIDHYSALFNEPIQQLSI